MRIRVACESAALKALLNYRSGAQEPEVNGLKVLGYGLREIIVSTQAVAGNDGRRTTVVARQSTSNPFAKRF